ncbi:VWA domain-containing protein [Treponema sp.]|uniref:VWA domain-containing protein n=1 Tax=Treponema sp. TaxID=166 RepID=UPI003EFC4E1B
MSFAVENPAFFYFFIPLAAMFFFVAVRYVRLKKSVCGKLFESKNRLFRISVCFWSRTVLRGVCGIFVILALAGISFGIDTVPVQKSGKAVSFVFDISYSMEAKDAPGGISRLQAASMYAGELLDRMNGCSVSVVLAKGDGISAVPLTEDFQSIRSLIENLSPMLMTSQGTSLGNGIKAAVSSFPEHSAAASYIWLFTDCEETDSMLQSSLLECVKAGIPVVVIGFGSERESEIFAGDGITKVKTALRADSIEKIISSLKEKNVLSKRNSASPSAVYIDASEMGSAAAILKTLNLNSSLATVSYEVKSTQRYRLFISLAILFFLASVLFGELDIAGGKKKIISSVLGASVVFLFTSCSPRFNDGMKIFEGRLSWSKQDYQNSVGTFLELSLDAHERGDELVEQYAVFGLGSTYLMQGETDAALKRFSDVYENSPEKIKFAILYNSGIIAHRNGDYERAADFFRKAILIDSKNIDAKINLEFSLKEDSEHLKDAAQEIIPLSENREDQNIQNALYSIIREDERKQWKNMQKDSERTSEDY